MSSALLQAAELGSFAADCLKVGGVFDGAWFWASSYGFEEGSEERVWFTHAFIAACPEHIVVDRDTGTITELIR